MMSQGHCSTQGIGGQAPCLDLRIIETHEEGGMQNAFAEKMNAFEDKPTFEMKPAYNFN